MGPSDVQLNVHTVGGLCPTVGCKQYQVIELMGLFIKAWFGETGIWLLLLLFSWAELWRPSLWYRKASSPSPGGVEIVLYFLCKHPLAQDLNTCEELLHQDVIRFRGAQSNEYHIIPL